MRKNEEISLCVIYKGTPRDLTHAGCTKRDLSHAGYNTYVT